MRKDNRRHHPLGEFKLPDFKYKASSSKVIGETVPPLFKGFESIARDLPADKRKTLVKRVNECITKQMKAINTEIAEEHYSSLNSLDCLGTWSNMERTQSICFQKLRQQLDVRKIATDEKAKLMSMWRDNTPGPIVPTADSEMNQYFQTMLQPKAGSRLSTRMLNTKMKLFSFIVLPIRQLVLTEG